MGVVMDAWITADAGLPMTGGGGGGGGGTESSSSTCASSTKKEPPDWPTPFQNTILKNSALALLRTGMGTRTSYHVLPAEIVT